LIQSRFRGKLMRFRHCQHIRRALDFVSLKSSGKRINCGSFVVLWQLRPEETGLPRLGLVASSRVGNAVVRNRAKRIFREIFRLNQEKLPKHCDLLVIARSGVTESAYSEVEGRFLKACDRISKEASQMKPNDEDMPS